MSASHREADIERLSQQVIFHSRASSSPSYLLVPTVIFTGRQNGVCNTATQFNTLCGCSMQIPGALHEHASGSSIERECL